MSYNSIHFHFRVYKTIIPMESSKSVRDRIPILLGSNYAEIICFPGTFSSFVVEFQICTGKPAFKVPYRLYNQSLRQLTSNRPKWKLNKKLFSSLLFQYAKIVWFSPSVYCFYIGLEKDSIDRQYFICSVWVKIIISISNSMNRFLLKII